MTRTWNDARLHIRGLFPKFAPNETERSLITTTLARLPPERVIAAANAYRCEEVGVVFRLASFLAVYRRISASRPTESSAKILRTELALREIHEERLLVAAQLMEREASVIDDALAALVKRGWLKALPTKKNIDDWSDRVVFLVDAQIRRAAND